MCIRQALLTAIVAPLLVLECCEDSSDSSSSDNESTSPQNPGPSTKKDLFLCDTRHHDSTSQREIASLFEEKKSALASSTSALNTSSAVFFHVLGRDTLGQNRQVPDEALVEQNDVLKRAYSGKTGGESTPYRFTMGGINHVHEPAWRTLSPGSTDEAEMKKTLRVGHITTLNVYITDIVPTKNQNVKGKILGFATFPFAYPMQPAMDGVVLNYRVVPGTDVANYNSGHVLVHKTGHWLGLFHTFTGECETPLNDLFTDTPEKHLQLRATTVPHIGIHAHKPQA